MLGAVLLVIGALAAIGGGALMALFGSNDTLSLGVQQVSTLTRALVSPAGSIRQGASGAQTVVGSVRLRITATPTRGPGISSSWASAQRARWTAISAGSAMLWQPTCLLRRFT